MSVVFSDLAGSTAMQEALDPESVRRVMGRYYEVMRSTVERFGGSIEKFIGDAVVAVFGTPTVREDDALRAVRCAAEMTVALEALNDELERSRGVRLAMRTGVNTGELVISNEGIIVGDTMNTAARLEQAAPAGHVLIGEATWRLVRHRVSSEEVEPLQLKGKAAPVRAWRLVSSFPGPAEAGTQPADAPLVGREPELARLGAVLDQAIAARDCRLVTVIGSPGLGKSRLAAEFAAQLGEQARVVHGHCEPSGEGNTFLPVAEVVRDVAAIADADDPGVAREKLLAINSDDPDRERIVEAVAGVLGITRPGSAQETFWALRRGLEVLARDRPLVVVFDDLHWAQPMLLDLLEHLVEWIADAPVLLVGLARPELREAREVLTATGRRATDVIELDPLPPAHSRTLVDGLLGGADVPVALLERILETTEGNPLFLGELIRMLAEEGTLVRTGDGWSVTGGADAVEVPPTIQALLAARIERLRADERAVVERAAVIGKQFYRGAVAELLAPPIRTAIDGHLEALRRKEMVEPEGIYWIDEPVYRFHHVLIRDAAYRLLLKEARAVLHERFADWLEAKAGDLVGEYEEVIAFHLEQAHAYLRELGPLDDAGRTLGMRAAARLLSAGRRALAREDLAAAQNLLSRALDCDRASEAEVLWDLAEAVLSAGDVSAAANVVDQYTASVGSSPRAAVIIAQLANLTGDDEPALTAESVRAAASELAKLGDGAAEAKAWTVAAATYARLGRVGEVETALDRALTAARTADDRRRTTAVLAAAPRAALWGPSSVVRSSGRCLDVVRILRMTPGNRHVEALALRCQAVLEAMRGRVDAAREILAGARATLEELGLTLELHETQVYAGTVELLADDPAAAVAHLRVALAGFQSLGADTAAAYAAAQLARALAALEGIAERDEAIAQAEFAQEHGGEDLRTAIVAASACAEALAQSGQIEPALELAERAVVMSDPTDALADKADAAMALARVLLAAGRSGEAREAARKALFSYDAKGHTVGARRAERLAPSRSLASEPAAPGPASAGLGDRAPERFYAEFVRRISQRDLGAVMALYAPGYVLCDHKPLATMDMSGTDVVRRALEGLFALSSDARCDVEEILACDDRVIALRLAYRGHANDGGGVAEFAIGMVSVIEDGQFVGSDQYEPDDRAAMIARYAEVGGGLAALGDNPPERWLAAYARGYAAGEMDTLVSLSDESYEFVDHRELGWEPLRGHEGVRALNTSAWEVGVVWIEVDEVLACDERVLAVRLTHHGIAAEEDTRFELPVGRVHVVENGRVVRTEQFASDGTAAMLARYAELGGRQNVSLGDSPPERVLLELQRTLHARDYDHLSEVVTEDCYIVDHRALGYDDALGRDACIRDMRAAFDASPSIRLEFDEVIAAADRVAVTRVAFRGRGVKAGELETGYIAVSLVDHGLLAGLEYYELNHLPSAIARYAELGGTRDRDLGDLPPERLWAQYKALWDTGDQAAIRDLYTEDCSLHDHRSMALWGDMHGASALAQLTASSIEGTKDRCFMVHEVLACDQEVIALRLSWTGLSGTQHDAPYSYDAGAVTVVRHGHFASFDVYDFDDRDAMLARFAELTTQPSPAPGDRPSLRVNAEELRRYATHDLESYSELYAEDFSLVDHRLNGWGTIEGRHGVLANAQMVLAVTPDTRMERDELIAGDDRVLALLIGYRGHAAEEMGGGEVEVVLGYVSVYEDGHVRTTDVYDPGERVAMVARYTELGGGMSVLGDSPPERASAEFAVRYARQDPAAFADLLADDFAVRDHRQIAWEPMSSADQFVALAKSAWEGSLDIRFEYTEVLAVDERAIATRARYVGHARDGGGEFSYEIGRVAVLEQGRWVSLDIFEPDDRDGMLARYAELGGTGATSHAETGSERFFTEFLRRCNLRDYDQMGEMLAPDCTWVDHRALGWETSRGREQVLAFMRSAFDASPGVRTSIKEVLASDDQVLAVIGAWHGIGGKVGPWKLEVGAVHVVRDGLLVSTDSYEPDDRETILTRFAELATGTVATENRSPERWVARYISAYNRQDANAFPDLFADGFTLVDHRANGWGTITGPEAMREHHAATFAVSLDCRIEIDEVLAGDPRAGAIRFTYRGHLADGGGEFEYSIGYVTAVQDGRAVSTDVYEPEDREAMLARFAELTEAPDPQPATPTVRVANAFVEAFNRRDPKAALVTFAEGYELRDHRTIGWGTIIGRETAWDHLNASLAIAPDIHLAIGEILADDGRVIAWRADYRGHVEGGGGLFEFPLGYVSVVEDGVLVSTDMYEADDREQLIATYVELGGGQAPLGHRPPEQVLRQWIRHYGASDFDAAKKLYAEDVVMIDHRQLGYEEAHGPEEAVTWSRSGRAASRELRLEIEEVIACDERALTVAVSWRGRGVKAGELSLPMIWVVVVQDGLVTRLDQYDPEDRAAALARFEELRASSPGPSHDARMPERIVRADARRYSAHDLDAFSAQYSEDCEIVDHRLIGWGTLSGYQAIRDGAAAAFANADDIRMDIDEVIAGDDRAVAVIASYRGHANEGDAEFELTYGYVAQCEDGLTVHADIYEADDREAILARFRELGS